MWTRSAKFCDKFYIQADIFKVQFCAISDTIKNEYIKIKKTPRQTSISVEFSCDLNIYNISIFDGAWSQTKLTVNFLKFGQFSEFELYCFCDLYSIKELGAML